MPGQKIRPTLKALMERRRNSERQDTYHGERLAPNAKPRLHHQNQITKVHRLTQNAATLREVSGSMIHMRASLRGLVVLVGFAVAAIMAPVASLGQDSNGQNLRADAAQIFALANRARSQAGVGRLQWDAALADAALAHCRRMVQEGSISHRYGGEQDVSGRAKQTGAHFSLIEENVAIGPSAAGVHDEWMHSEGHRENLLSPQVDRVGVAVIAARGVLYAVADYSRSVENLGASQIEARVGEMVRQTGAIALRDPAVARQACAMDSGVPRGQGSPRFIMRWQSGDLDQLPQQLVQRLRTGQYRQASVGSCSAQGVESFSAYRLAVLLY